MNKNPNCPTCIDLIFTNRDRSFQNTITIETGLSDFHKLTPTVLKVNFQKQKPKTLYYRNYKNFDNDIFSTDLNAKFNNTHHRMNCRDIENTILKTLSIHAQCAEILNHFFSDTALKLCG